LADVSSPRERAAIQGILLKAALHGKNTFEGDRAARELGKFSKQFPSLASHLFWDAIRGSPAARAESAIRVFRRSGGWSEIDQSKYARFMRSEEGLTVQMAGLRTDLAEAEIEVHLPIASQLPTVEWDAQVSAHLISAYEQDAALHRGSPGNE
jgi:hypothetical protein